MEVDIIDPPNGITKVEVDVTDVPDGIKGAFPDGTCTWLTNQGSACTCGKGDGVVCRHIRALVPAYNVRKWQLAEDNRENYGPTYYRRMGLDPRIFIPPPIDWAQYPGEPFICLDGVQQGRLFLFPDGASIWVGDLHPEGRTKCSACGTRDCRHYEMVAAESAEPAREDEVVGQELVS